MITSLYAAPLGLLLIILSIRTLRLRRGFQVAYGDGKRPELVRAIRAHANFIEYVPLALLLCTLTELGNGPPWLVHSVGGTLLLGRCIHAYGISQVDEDFRLRVAGMSPTFTALLLGIGGALWTAL